MQNNFFFFSFFGNPNVREAGGCQADWDKIPTFTENLFLWLPLRDVPEKYPLKIFKTRKYPLIKCMLPIPEPKP